MKERVDRNCLLALQGLGVDSRSVPFLFRNELETEGNILSVADHALLQKIASSDVFADCGELRPTNFAISFRGLYDDGLEAHNAARPWQKVAGGHKRELRCPLFGRVMLDGGKCKYSGGNTDYLGKHARMYHFRLGLVCGFCLSEGRYLAIDLRDHFKKCKGGAVHRPQLGEAAVREGRERGWVKQGRITEAGKKAFEEAFSEGSS